MQYDRGVYDENGYVKIRVWLGPKRNPDGTFNKPYRRSYGCVCNLHIQEANNHVREVRDNFKKGIRPAPEAKPLWVPIACEIYFKLHWVEKRGRTAEAIKNTSYVLEHFKRYWSDAAWHSITPQKIEAFIRDRQKLGIAAGTIKRELAILSSMFTMIAFWITRREMPLYLQPTDVHGMPYNPVKFVVRPENAMAKRERVASEEELMRVIAFCKASDPDMLIMIERAVCTGLRKTDLEKVNGLKDVRGVLSKSKERKLFRMPVDFSQKISYSNFDRRWDALREACQMQDFHWHDWRATAGTLLELLGFSEESIQRFYGHSSIQQTRDYLRGKQRLKPHVDALQGHFKKISDQVPEPVPSDPTKRVCRGCGKELDLSRFGKHSAFKDGLDSRCKACNYARTKRRRAAIPGLRAAEYAKKRSLSSAVERSPYTRDVTGSIPVGTNFNPGSVVSQIVSQNESSAEGSPTVN